MPERSGSTMSWRFSTCSGYRPVPGQEGGAYVPYPMRDMVRIIARESRRNRCLVIGEDLGTVPEDSAPPLQEAGILSYRVLYFERGQDKGFMRRGIPAGPGFRHHPRSADAARASGPAATSRWRDLLRRFPDEDASTSAHAARGRDRILLLQALHRAGLLPAGIDPDAAAGRTSVRAGRLPCTATSPDTPGQLVMVQLEDALGEEEQAEPARHAEEHPNWRRKLGQRPGAIRATSRWSARLPRR